MRSLQLCAFHIQGRKWPTQPQIMFHFSPSDSASAHHPAWMLFFESLTISDVWDTPQLAIPLVSLLFSQSCCEKPRLIQSRPHLAGNDIINHGLGRAAMVGLGWAPAVVLSAEGYSANCALASFCGFSAEGGQSEWGLFSLHSPFLWGGHMPDRSLAGSPISLTGEQTSPPSQQQPASKM